jgi:transposase InsO family protein
MAPNVGGATYYTVVASRIEKPVFSEGCDVVDFFSQFDAYCAQRQRTEEDKKALLREVFVSSSHRSTVEVLLSMNMTAEDMVKTLSRGLKGTSAAIDPIQSAEEHLSALQSRKFSASSVALEVNSIAWALKTLETVEGGSVHKRKILECCPETVRHELEEKYGSLSALPPIGTLVNEVVRRVRRHAISQLPQSTKPVVVKSSRESELEAEIRAMKKKIEEMSADKKVHATTESVSIAAPAPYGGFERRPNCIYCDSLDHAKAECLVLRADIDAGKVGLDWSKFVIYPETQGRVAPNYGKGGMKALVEEYHRQREAEKGSAKVKHVRVEEDVIPTLFVKVESAEEILEEESVEIMMAKRKRINDFEDLDDHNEGVVLRKGGARVEVVDAETNTEKREKRFTHLSKIEETKDEVRLLSEVLNAKVQLTVRDVLAHIPSARSAFKKEIKSTRRPISKDVAMGKAAVSTRESEDEVDDESSDDEEDVEGEGEQDRKPTVTTPSTHSHGVIGGHRVALCLDMGAEASIMGYDQAMELGLKVDREKKDSIAGVLGGAARGEGRCVNVPIKMGDATLRVTFLINKNFKGTAIIGLPTLYDHDVQVRNDKNNKKWMILRSWDGSAYVKFPVSVEREPGEIIAIKRVMVGGIVERVATRDDETVVAVCSIHEDETLKILAAKYKPVDRKVRPVAAQVPVELQLQGVDVEQSGGKRLTNERLETMQIGDGLLSDVEVDHFKQCLHEVDDAFAFQDSEMGLLKASVEPPVRVPMVPHTPWSHAPYPVPRALHDQVVELLKAKMAAGVIEPSIGGYANRWFVVKKKDGKTLRFIQDAQEVNRHTIRNSGVPPNADELAEDVSGRVIVSVFDLYSGYDQIPLHPEDRDIFALQTPIGLVRMTRLPQGWTNSVGIYQRLMTKVLIKFIPSVVSVFLDDGYVKGSRQKDETRGEDGVRKFVRDHIDDVVAVLRTLKEAGLTVNGRKCHWGVSSATVLGYHCSEKGREPTEEAREKLGRWPTPEDLTGVRAYLAFCSRYKGWVDKFSEIADPLYELTRKGVAFYWGEKQKEAFIGLREGIIKSGVIRAPEYGEGAGTLILTVDASPIGVGGVLTQEDKNGERRVIRFESELLNDTQRRYAQVKRELYGVFAMVKKLRKYLHGVRFVLETDAKPVIGMLFRPELPDSPQARWVAYINKFDRDLRHIPGKENEVADALSRHQCRGEQENPAGENDPDVMWVGIEALSESDEEGEESEVVREVKRRRAEEDFEAGRGAKSCIVSGDDGWELGLEEVRQVSSVQMSVLSRYYNIVQLLTTGINLESKPRKRIALEEVAKQYFLSEEGLLFFKHRNGQPKRVLDNPGEQLRVMRSIHSGHPSSHRGVEGTLRLCSDRFYWRGMKKDAEEVVRKCEACQKEGRRQRSEPLKPYLGSTLFSRVGIDLVELPRAITGEAYLAVVRDDFSGWVEAKALPSKEAFPVYRFLYEEVIARFGLPGEIVADQGEMHGAFIQELAGKDGLTLKFTSPYHPETNGMVERGHKSLIECIRKLSFGDELNWPRYLASALWADRTSWRRTTGETPFRLVYGFDCVLPTDTKHWSWAGLDWRRVKDTAELLETRALQLMSTSWLREVAGQALDKSRINNKEWFDKAHRLREESLKKGDLVLMRNHTVGKKEGKLVQRWMGPFRVRMEVHEGVYQIEGLDGVMFRKSVAGKHLCPFYI